MEEKTFTIPRVQNNNEVRQLQDYSFRTNSFWPSTVSVSLTQK